MRTSSVTSSCDTPLLGTLLTTGEVARLLQITRSGVRWLVDAGRLDCERTPSGVRYFRAGLVMRLVAQRATDRLRQRGEILAALRPRMLRVDLEPRQLSFDFRARPARLQLV